MSKPLTLESLLAAFDKTEQLRADTEALKPRLETEINAVLASGDALNESLAGSLAVKKSQLELVPAKLSQISRRADELTAAIQAEFQNRFRAFDSELQSLQAKTKKKVLDVLGPLMIDSLVVQELFDRMIWTRTKPAAELSGLRSGIDFQLSQGNVVQAARELLQREKELAVIKARP